MTPMMLMYAMQVLQALPGLIIAGAQVVSLIEQTNASLKQMQLENRDPTPQEWDALNQSIATLRAQLHTK